MAGACWWRSPPGPVLQENNVLSQKPQQAVVMCCQAPWEGVGAGQALICSMSISVV